MANGAQGDQSKGKAAAQLFTREPVMLTLPFAYTLALIVWKFPGGGWSESRWAALLSAAVLSVAVFLIDRWSAEEQLSKTQTRLRLVYLVLNMIILTGLLVGLTTIEQLSALGG
jgi:hypothetical protein